MKYVLILCLAGLIFGPASNGLGQKENDGPVGIFQSRAEYNQFMGGAKQAAYGENGNPELQAMIPLLNDIVLNQPVGETANKYGVQASTLGLLSDPNVRAELEMVDDQYEDLKRLNSEIQERTASQLRGLDFQDTANLAKQIRFIRERSNEDLDAVLLPHQLDRLRQIQMQSQLKRRSLVDILTNDPLKSDLDITDQQSEQLREEEKEIEEDLAREIAKLRERARDRLLSKLKPSQKSEIEKMIGDTFEFKQPEKTKNPTREKVKKERIKAPKSKGKVRIKGA
jgi:hypothetical protein